jgi:uncharacterized protein YbjT (DUF2867 family)
LLLKEGFAVRAFVHKADERSDKLKARGAEIVVGDLLELDEARSALKDVDAAYFVYPIRPGLIDATAYFAQAAKDAGLDGVVNMPQISARYDSKSHAARDHWIAERVFDWSAVPVTHIRPTFFAQWLTYPHSRKHILERGVISEPLGTGRHATIAAGGPGASDRGDPGRSGAPQGADLSVVRTRRNGPGRYREGGRRGARPARRL